MRQLLIIALRNLGTHRRRSLMLGGAIAGVTALLVILMGLANGIQQTLLESATTLLTGHVNVAGFYKPAPGQGSPVLVEYPKVLEHLKREVPELDHVVQRGRGWVRMVSESSALQVGLVGIEVSQETRLRKAVKLAEGSMDALAKPGTAMLFEDQAKRLKVKVGDSVTLLASTTGGAYNSVDVRVGAIAYNMGVISSFNIFVPDTTLRGLYRLREDSTGALMLYLKDLDDLPQVQQRLRVTLAAAGYELMEPDARPFWTKLQGIYRQGWIGQRLDITSWQQEISFLQWSVSTLNGLTGVLTFVLLVIIAVGVMNTLWIAIRERTQEVGTMRAIGTPRTWVVIMFLLEALCLGLLSTVAGAVLGTLVCALLNALHLTVPTAMRLFLMSDELHLAVEPSSVLAAVAFITLCTAFVSLVPSFIAARLSPVTAMHHPE